MKSDIDQEENPLIKPDEVPAGITLMEHDYDGIQEYDQRLPRWWLITLYGAIIYSIIYWMFFHTFTTGLPETHAIDRQLEAVEAIRLANSIDVTNNELFWEMAGNPTFVSNGRAHYNTHCAACHGPNLEGGIGMSLVKNENWVHGAAPSAMYQVIDKGVLEKGMQPWGTLLGQKRMAETVAFILSRNDSDALKAAASHNAGPPVQPPQ